MMLIAQFLFYVFMELLVYGLMYSIGRFMIPIVSFGHARAVRVKEIFAPGLPAYDEDGKMLISEVAARILGFATVIALVLLLSPLWRA